MKFIILLMLFVLGNTSFSQTTKLQGELTAEGVDTEIGQITVYTLPDSSLIKGSYIDSSYFFLLLPSTDALNYYAIIKFPGYVDRLINFQIKDSIVSLGNIVLEKDLTLGTVEVVFQAPLYERTIDGIKVNVEGTTLEKLDNLFEVLKSSPKIMSPDDESIEIIGKGVPLILIDRQPILSNEELKAIPANMIDRIEIITNPSAKYKAQGRENGVIEVFTKNFRLQGYNMSINAQGGIISQVTPIGSLGIALSLKKGKFSFSGSLYGRYLEQTNNGFLDRTILDSTQRTVSWNNSVDYLQYSQNINLKASYQIKPQKTISAGILASGFAYSSESIWSGIYYTDGVPQISEDQLANDKTNWFNNSAFLNYIWVTDTNNSNLEINLNYQLKINEGSIIHLTDYKNLQTSEFQDFDLRNNSRNRPNIAELRVTYEHVFDTTGWKLSAGGAYSVVFNRQELDVLNLVNDYWIVDTAYSNSYDYIEQIGGAFVELSKEWDKLSARVGIRSELTNLNGYSYSLSKQFMDSVYILPFPSASIMYQPGDKIALTLRYTSGINRPQFSNYDPFVRRTDSLTVQYGNPYLRPATTQSFGIDLDLFYKYRISIDHAVTFNPTTQRMFIEDTSFLFVFTPWNADQSEQTSMSLGLPLQTKWMDGWTYLSLTYNKFKFSPIFNLPVITNLSYVVWSALNFHLKGNITISNQFYFFKYANFANSQNARARWTIQVSKKLYNNKLSLSLIVSDIFPFKSIYKESGSNYVSNGRDQNIFTDFQIGVFYKFGRLKKDTQIKESTSEESDRL